MLQKPTDAEEAESVSMEDVMGRIYDEAQEDSSGTEGADNRDTETGRFKGSKEDGAPSESPTSTDEDGKPSESKTEDTPETGSVIPENFSAEDKAALEGIPPEKLPGVMNIFKRLQADHTRKSQELAEFKKGNTDFVNVHSKYAQYHGSIGTTPVAMFDWLGGIEHQLRTGDKAKQVALFQNLHKSYGLSASDFGGAEPSDKTEGAGKSIMELDPAMTEIAALRKTVDGFISETKAEKDARLNAEGQKALKDVITFRDEVGSDGKKLRPDFELVREMMGTLSARPEYRDASLEKLYEAAVWAHPATRAKAEAALKGKLETDTTTRNRSATATAKKLARPGLPRPKDTKKPGSAAGDTIDDTLAKVYDEMQGDGAD